MLTQRLETCSLKSSALLQAVRGLPADIEVVAVVDADVVAPVWWLRELVRPFADPQVVMSGGLRWFLPEQTNCGSGIRRIWGAAASAQMYSLNIPRGGTLCLFNTSEPDDEKTGVSLGWLAGMHTINNVDHSRCLVA